MEEYVEILEFLTHTHTDTQGVHHVDALLFFLYSCIYPPPSCSFLLDGQETWGNCSVHSTCSLCEMWKDDLQIL